MSSSRRPPNVGRQLTLMPPLPRSPRWSTIVWTAHHFDRSGPRRRTEPSVPGPLPQLASFFSVAAPASGRTNI